MSTATNKTAEKVTISKSDVGTVNAVMGKAADEKKAKKAARKASQKAAKAVIFSAITDEKVAKTLPESLLAALKALYAKAPTSGGSGTGLTDKVAAMFAALEIGGAIDELAMFKAFKIGRGEMRKRARLLLRDALPAERLWIAFDEASEAWVLKGKGANAPAGWRGFLPVEE